VSRQEIFFYAYLALSAFAFVGAAVYDLRHMLWVGAGYHADEAVIAAWPEQGFDAKGAPIPEFWQEAA
jgi:hypothetical protein